MKKFILFSLVALCAVAFTTQARFGPMTENASEKFFRITSDSPNPFTTVDHVLVASSSNDITKYQQAEVVAGCMCPQDWFWQPGWIWGGYWVRQCFETRGEDIFPFNYIDQSSQSNKPTYNPCN